MKHYRVGYTQGVYDMFHVGHLNLINRAKEYCDYLIVGVNADNLVYSYKNKIPVIREDDRAEIVRNIKAVDECIIVHSLNKVEALQQIGFNVIFIGDDWKGNPRWERDQIELSKYGVDVVFLPHTPGISSTILRPEEKEKIDE